MVVNGFATMSKNVSGSYIPITRDEFRRAQEDPFLADKCARIKAGDIELKAQLPVWTPCCGEFRNNHRSEADAVKRWQRTMFDVDEKGHTDDILAKMDDREGEKWIGPFLILQIEVSVRGGTHIVVELPDGMTRQEAQQVFSELIGLPVDPAVKNVAGVLYMTPWGDVKHQSDRLFTPIPEVEVEPKAPKAKVQVSTSGSTFDFHLSPEKGDELFDAVRDKCLYAFDSCVKVAGLDLENLDIWGQHNWHTNLMAVLSAGLPKLIDKQQCEAVVRERLPNYSQYPDCQRLIDSFYDQYQARTTGVMSRELRAINAAMQHIDVSVPSEKNQEQQLASMGMGYAKPVCPKKPVGLFRLIAGNYDTRYSEELMLAALPALAAHAPHFRAVYLNNRLTPPQQFAVVIGASGSGKNFASNMLEMLCSQTIAKHDEAEWDLVAQNQTLRDQLANSPQKPAKYTPKIIMFEKLSQTSMLSLMKNLGPGGMLLGHFSEVDGLTAGNRQEWSNLTVPLRKGWSGERYSQYFQSDSSISCSVDMNISLLMCGTQNAVLGRLLSDTEGGFMQRCLPIVFSTPRSFQPPKQGLLSPEKRAQLDGLMTNLWQKNLALGDNLQTLDMPKTNRVIANWLSSIDVEYNAGRVSEAEADLTHRAAEMGFRAAIPLVALYGEETREILDFARWVAERAWYGQCSLFANKVDRDLAKAEQTLAQANQRVAANKTALLSLLPPVFTTQDVQAARIKLGQTSEVRMLLTRYCRDGLIERVDRGKYRKLK